MSNQLGTRERSNRVFLSKTYRKDVKKQKGKISLKKNNRTTWRLCMLIAHVIVFHSYKNVLQLKKGSDGSNVGFKIIAIIILKLE